MQIAELTVQGISGILVPASLIQTRDKRDLIGQKGSNTKSTEYLVFLGTKGLTKGAY